MEQTIEFGKEMYIYIPLLVAATTATVEMLKKTGWFKTQHLPVVSFIVGILLGLAAMVLPGAGSIGVMLWAGGTAGLGGTWAYEFVTNRAKKYGEDDK